jgi:hypothetical protein
MTLHSTIMRLGIALSQSFSGLSFSFFNDKDYGISSLRLTFL